MRRSFPSIWLKLFFAFFLCWHQSSLAAIQAYESFDDTNAWGALPWSSYTNTFTNTQNWVVNNAKITTDATAPSLSNICSLNGLSSPAFVVSPSLSNGVGAVIFYARIPIAGSTNQVVAESSSGDGNWIVHGPTNTVAISTSWTAFTNSVSSTNSYVRLRKLNYSSSAYVVYLDNIAIAYNPATVSITNLSIGPSAPVEYDSLCVTAALSVVGYSPDTLSVTNYWKLSSSANWTAIAMTSNQSNVFTTSSNIPGQQAFSAIEYFAKAVKSFEGISYVTNSVTNSIIIAPRSSYSSIIITNSINAPLTLYSNYLWQGVAYVSNANSSFKFLGTSNSTQTLWGDNNQIFSNQFALGNADIGAANISLYTTNTGLHLFTFDESDYTFKARPCVRENFDSWTTDQPFGNYTNQWTLSGATVSNDTASAYVNSYAVLNGKPDLSTNTFLLSPLLTNGIGDISFWFRKGGPAGNPPGAFNVQVAPTPSSTNWTTIAAYTNIISPTYAFMSIPRADLNNQAIRILNNPFGRNSRICLDEVVVAAPGAAVYVSNLTNTPSAPGSSDRVNIEVDLTPNSWATITNVAVWFRGASNLLYQSIPMIQTSSNHYITTNGLPPYLGTVQYAIEYRFSGPFAISPSFYPSAGTNLPTSYTTTNTAANYRYETFDSSASWGTLPWTVYTNSATNTSGWTVSNAKIAADATAPSPPYACQIKGDTTTTIISPLLSNGVGSIVFNSKVLQTVQPNQFVLERSSGDGSWTLFSLTNNVTATTWSSFTNIVMSPTNLYLRLRLNTSNLSSIVFLDNIYCTPYPADIAITNITLNPGYPAVGQAVMISCDIQSVTPEYEAFSFTPTLNWTKNGVVQTAIPMAYTAGNTFRTLYPIVLTNVPRDTPVSFWVVSTFAGYHALPLEDRSPRSASGPSINVRTFASSFSNVAANINGADTMSRLLTNGLWQSIVSVSGPTNLAFSLDGFGYSVGNGAQTDVMTWGNSNNWQSSLPFTDFAGTNQNNITMPGITSGQYVVRFNELTGQYFVQKCLFQDFDPIGYDTTDKYVLKGLSSTSAGSGVKFNNWPTNVSQSRVENFSGGIWSTATNAPQAFGGGSYSFLSWFNTYSNASMRTPDIVSTPLSSYFVQASHWDPQPSLDGIGRIVCTFKPSLSNAAQMTLYYKTTNGMDQATDFGNSATWTYLANTNNITNTSQNCVWTNLVNTNLTLDIIFAPTSKMNIVQLEVSDWYSAENGVDGWIAHQSWMEVDPSDTNNTRCRLEASRAKPGVDQALESPAITGGISVISFDYGALTTNPVGFILQACYTDPANWVTSATNLDIRSNVVFSSLSTYSNYSYALMSSAPSIHLRLLNTTPAPGALLLRTFSVEGFATTNDWYLNNCNVDYMAPAPPLSLRQYYIGACYLNSNYVANVATGATNKPDTNIATCIKSPALAEGIGEISFWYRNWGPTNVPAQPAQILIQKSTSGGNNDSEWTTFASISCVTNTKDYAYYETDIYDKNAHYIRICNDLTYSNNVGRVCLDDILITAPWASTLSLSNLVINPGIPLYNTPVHIAVDVRNLFYAPSNLNLTAYYSTASSYTGLASASLSELPMTCITSNLTTPGQSFRYQTSQPIPTNTSDTFVKYYVSASFDGYHTEVTSPKTNNQFSTYPSWLNPLNTINGTGSAYYIVFSCPTGSVWINEFNIVDFSYDPPYVTKENQYIEICGKNGADIRNWSLQILDYLAHTQAFYGITNSTIFNNSTNGFGFWVIGKSGISGIQQTLTNDIPTAGGFRLSRPSGVTADSVCYTINVANPSGVSALTGQGFKYAGYDDDYFQTSLILVGSNTNGFSWTLGTDTHYSLGQINDGQVFVGITSTSVPPTIIIYSVRINTNVWIECSGTNNWAPTPWYSTNLINTNGWLYVTPFGSTYPTLSPSNTFTLNFPQNRFTNSSTYFFKVVTTNTP